MWVIFIWPNGTREILKLPPFQTRQSRISSVLPPDWLFLSHILSGWWWTSPPCVGHPSLGIYYRTLEQVSIKIHIGLNIFLVPFWINTVPEDYSVISYVGSRSRPYRFIIPPLPSFSNLAFVYFFFCHHLSHFPLWHWPYLLHTCLVWEFPGDVPNITTAVAHSFWPVSSLQTFSFFPLLNL